MLELLGGPEDTAFDHEGSEDDYGEAFPALPWYLAAADFADRAAGRAPRGKGQEAAKRHTRALCELRQVLQGQDQHAREVLFAMSGGTNVQWVKAVSRAAGLLMRGEPLPEIAHLQVE